LKRAVFLFRRRRKKNKEKEAAPRKGGEKRKKGKKGREMMHIFLPSLPNHSGREREKRGKGKT